VEHKEPPTSARFFCQFSVLQKQLMSADNSKPAFENVGDLADAVSKAPGTGPPLRSKV
jgi:hypothetical protein